MKILLTGATGYIGKRLLPVLLQDGHEVICCVRDPKRFSYPESFIRQVQVAKADFLSGDGLATIPKDFDIAFYLIHSMTSSTNNFDEMEKTTAQNFMQLIEQSDCKQVIYLSGIVNEKTLSKHLNSRYNVEKIFTNQSVALTTLRAGIIVGSGSASFEIIRDLTEKLPVMVAPKWLNTPTQPIAIRDIISCLTGVMLNKDCYNQSFDIGGPEVLTYKKMLLRYAKARKLKRGILTSGTHAKTIFLLALLCNFNKL